jgi:hypothetical protein
MTRRSRGALLAAAAFAFAGAAPSWASTSFGWTAASSVSPPGDYASVALAPLPGGGVVVASGRDDGGAESWARRSSSAPFTATPFDPTMDLISERSVGCRLPVLASAPDGSVTVVCGGQYSVVAARLAPGATTWSAPDFVVSPSYSVYPCAWDVAIAGDGTPVAAVSIGASGATKSGCRSELHEQPAGGPTWTLAESQADVVTAGGDGTLVDVYVQPTHKDSGPLLRARVRQPGSASFGGPVTLASSAQGFHDLRAAVAADGTVAVAFGRGETAIDLATLRPGATRWSCGRVVGPAPDSCIRTRRVRRPVQQLPVRVPEALRFLPGGRLVVAWHEGDDHLGSIYVTSRARSAVAWSRPLLLDSSAAVDDASRASGVGQRETAFAVQLTTDRAGRALLAWVHYRGVDVPTTIRLARLAPGGGIVDEVRDVGGVGAAEFPALIAPPHAPAALAFLDLGSIDRRVLLTREVQ